MNFKQFLLICLGLYLMLTVAQITGLLDRLNEIFIRNNLPDQVNRITGLRMPNDVKVLNVTSMTALNGEGALTMALELTEPQKQQLIEQVRNNLSWRFVFNSLCLTKDQNIAASQSKSPIPESKNSYIYSKTKTGDNRYAILCPDRNLLIVKAFD